MSEHDTDSSPSDASTDANTAAPDAGASHAGAAAGAVDTGRRIDPSLLKREPVGTIRRARPEDDVKRPQRDATPHSTSPSETAPASESATTSSATINARAAEAPAQERPRGPRPEGRPEGRRDGPPRGPGGPRREGGRDGPRGPRRDGGRPDGGRDKAEATERKAPRGPDFKDMPLIKVQRDEDVGDFAAMLAQTGPIDRVDVRIGHRVKAKCVHIGSETAFFTISRTQEANAPTADFLDDEGNCTLKEGDSIEAFVTGLGDGITLSTRLGKDQVDVSTLEQARISGIPLQGTIAAVNKGGAEVTLSGRARGFCPIGQLDINFVEDPQTLIGKTFEFLVKEVRENGRNIVLSRKALQERERKEKSKKLLETLAVGQQLKGTVTRVQPFGAFVDLGGIDGLVPVSELAWGHVKDPSEVVKIGQMLTVEVRKIEDDPKRPGQLRISLSLRAALEDPMTTHQHKLVRGARFLGVIRKLEQFGAFVELLIDGRTPSGLQGLVHISEIADRRIVHPKDVLNEGETVEAIVLEVDPATRRIALSLRDGRTEQLDAQAQANATRSEHRSEAPARPRVGRGTPVEGVVERIERYGVFVKLDPVNGVELGSALMPASETGTPRGADLGKAFPIGKRLSLLVIEMDERQRLKVSATAREQADERALVQEFNASAGQKGVGLGTFADLLKARR